MTPEIKRFIEYLSNYHSIDIHDRIIYEWNQEHESVPTPSMGAEEIEKWYRDWMTQQIPTSGDTPLSMLKDFAASHQPGGWSESDLKKLLLAQIEECRVHFDRCARDKGVSSKETNEWIESTPLINLSPLNQ